MSRKIILYIAASLDGYIAEVDGSIDFLTADTSPEVEAFDSYTQLLERIDTVILGRTTYNQLVNELTPGEYPYEDKTSYIITHHPIAGKEQLIFTDEQPDELVQRLKEEEGKDIWIVGGGQIIAPLVVNNLIDEYVITTVPILLGKGIPLFKEMNKSVRVRVVDSYIEQGMITSIYSKTDE
ncbi:dihydrofolate reductase family protein [Enterococcus sp. BWR-S5]|uniref:dihydrofolate reductase family protein n=1 Tax=Enterococcus sp. BWR-S5 TaxID=2787714 RepID=UPI001920534E|nr:dihydrofolate reductase family protein [Enterococcus sp. BWR-S5]MBL1224858.1 dihydrofolate reductase [Enterococcus sp. BWR-S5]